MRLPGLVLALFVSLLGGLIAFAVTHLLACLVRYCLERKEYSYARKEAEREMVVARMNQFLFGTPGITEDGTVVDLFLATRRLKRKRVGF